jgi:hypothetical protein
MLRLRESLKLLQKTMHTVFEDQMTRFGDCGKLMLFPTKYAQNSMTYWNNMVIDLTLFTTIFSLMMHPDTVSSFSGMGQHTQLLRIRSLWLASLIL